ncbi:cyclic pyranopterin monophosphate synthase MoaC [Verrucomicrobiaceae bacterium N1E253]|uniref:Cyclic pyranopterin monophosphate synthase MoaC n=1 Tax=Oceaniferula marina TaxID=2748318 RepID=A0A851GNU6_9BACT|nr:cyclic pyranopterin monophosphate synthase MoaC [Oceaniferula marina]NWK56707.1 cyclic pyranopterin monophosphate synthase MoaC [Oceaniferula marina]
MSLTHVNENNQPGMVDVSRKERTRRVATAQSLIEVGPDVMALLADGDIQSKKGPVFHTAIIAGTMAAKKTSELIPFCHPIPLEDCTIVITPEANNIISITCTCITTSRTGIEMEALAGASGAALTLYDMCKAVCKSMRILETKLLKKTGGKSDYSAT